MLGVQSVSESALTLRLTAKTRPNRQWAVKRAITERVVSDLRASSAASTTSDAAASTSSAA